MDGFHNLSYVMVLNIKSKFRVLGGVSEPDTDSTYGDEGCLFFRFPFPQRSSILGFGNQDHFRDNSSRGEQLTSALS